MKSSKNILNNFRKKLSGPDARFYAFVIFLTIVFFTGGSSRDDVQSLILLRPLSILFCAYAVTVRVHGEWNGRLFPIYILFALLALMAIQLVPLPPSVWTGLPGRQIFANIADISGIEQPWRPLTLSPSRTLNSLFSLSIPVAAIMLYLNLDRRYQKSVVTVIIVLCAISALWAIIQVVGSSRGPLYLYRITNFGIGVGLFANRNHQAVMLASSIVMLGWYAANLDPTAKLAKLKHWCSIAAVFVFVPLIFITGSRAGLLLMVPALMFALFFVYFGKYYAAKNTKKKSAKGSKYRLLFHRNTILFAGVLVATSISVLSILLSRSLAFDRLFGASDLGGLRFQVLPTLVAMARDFIPWGSGFGSFEHIYKIYEPQQLLNPSYLNQAHNDWLQYPIEGGILAVLIAISALIWVCMRFAIIARNWRTPRFVKFRALMCLMVMLFVLAASIGDYPLRVPSIMAIFAILVSVFDDSVRSVQRHEIKDG